MGIKPTESWRSDLSGEVNPTFPTPEQEAIVEQWLVAMWGNQWLVGIFTNKRLI